MEFAPNWLNNKMTSTDDPIDIYINITFRSDNYFLIKEFHIGKMMVIFQILKRDESSHYWEHYRLRRNLLIYNRNAV